MKNRKRLWSGLAVAAIGISLAFSTHAQAGNIGDSVTLESLLNGGGSVMVGDKLFDDFGYYAIGDMPNADEVNVISHKDIHGNYGLRFQGAFRDNFGGSASDALIDFRVTVLDPNYLISDAHLYGNPTVVGNGSGDISVVETFENRPGNRMEISDVNGNITLADETIFAVPTRVLMVEKDIMANTTDIHSVATMSFVDQTFSQVSVPEPGSMTLAGMSLLGLAFSSRRKRYCSNR